VRAVADLWNISHHHIVEGYLKRKSKGENSFFFFLRQKGTM
jgi:hypothetical protein